MVWPGDPLDWLDDPLRDFDTTSGEFHHKTLTRGGPDTRRWFSFHFATRLKLEGCVHFASQAIGAANVPDSLGLPLANHRQLIWNLDAFFFELYSAYETLLQEINIVYDYQMGVDKVSWRSIQGAYAKNYVYSWSLSGKKIGLKG